jgi:hypothetical protein
MRIPTRVAGDTIQTYIDDTKVLFGKAGGEIIPLPNQIGPNAGRTVAQINLKDKKIYLFKGSEKQDLVEELLHFRQANKGGYWGKGGVPDELGGPNGIWEKQVDTLFKNLGFVPR